MKTIDERKVIKHLFNNHEYCDCRWFRPKKLLETNRKNKKVSESNEETKNNIEIQRTKVSYYRNKAQKSTFIIR